MLGWQTSSSNGPVDSTLYSAMCTQLFSRLLASVVQTAQLVLSPKACSSKQYVPGKWGNLDTTTRSLWIWVCLCLVTYHVHGVYHPHLAIGSRKRYLTHPAPPFSPSLNTKRVVSTNPNSLFVVFAIMDVELRPPRHTIFRRTTSPKKKTTRSALRRKRI